MINGQDKFMKILWDGHLSINGNFNNPIHAVFIYERSMYWIVLYLQVAFLTLKQKEKASRGHVVFYIAAIYMSKN